VRKGFTTLERTLERRLLLVTGAACMIGLFQIAAVLMAFGLVCYDPDDHHADVVPLFSPPSRAQERRRLRMERERHRLALYREQMRLAGQRQPERINAIRPIPAPHAIPMPDIAPSRRS